MFSALYLNHTTIPEKNGGFLNDIQVDEKHADLALLDSLCNQLNSLRPITVRAVSVYNHESISTDYDVIEFKIKDTATGQEALIHYRRSQPLGLGDYVQSDLTYNLPKRRNFHIIYACTKGWREPRDAKHEAREVTSAARNLAEAFAAEYLYK